MNKFFNNIDISLKKIIIFAIIIGVSVGLLNSVPILYNTSLTDAAIYFDIWILFGIIIIINSKSNKESAIKCFIFFLISQPLIYLVEVPFSHLGWQLFNYYKYWFLWTIMCLPMGYIGYYIKREKWWGILILLPIMMLLGNSIMTHLSNIIFSFPKHIISYLFCILSLIMYPIIIFNKKNLRKISLIINILIIIGFSALTIINKPIYETDILCSGNKYYFDNDYKVTLKDKKYGEVSIIKIDSIDTYCVHSKFKKAGDTQLILKSPNNDKEIFNLNIERTTYDIKKVKTINNANSRKQNIKRILEEQMVIMGYLNEKNVETFDIKKIYIYGYYANEPTKKHIEVDFDYACYNKEDKCINGITLNKVNNYYTIWIYTDETSVYDITSGISISKNDIDTGNYIRINEELK